MLSVIFRTFFAEEGIISLLRSSRYILQPRPTAQDWQKALRWGDLKDSIEHTFFTCSNVCPLRKLVKDDMVLRLCGYCIILEISYMSNNLILLFIKKKHYVLCLFIIFRIVLRQDRRNFPRVKLFHLFFMKQLKVKIRVKRKNSLTIKCSLVLLLEKAWTAVNNLSIIWFDWALWYINHCRLFNAKFVLYIYIKSIWFSLVGFYGISTIVGYSMPNPLYRYISNIYDLVWFDGISTIAVYLKPNPFYTYILNRYDLV